MLNPAARERLFGMRHALEDPVTATLAIAAAVVLALSPVVIRALQRRGKLSQRLTDDLWTRYKSWLILAPLMIVPVLMGAFWTILSIGVLSIFCYREFARASGLFRERAVSLTVVLGILATFAAIFDHWYSLFIALGPLTVGTIAAVPILSDRPKGFIQRVALGVFSFMLFGSSFGHLAYFANDAGYRRILFWIVMSVELNDVFAYVSGKSLGHRKLAPNTSPNKTVGGAIGAVVVTTALSAYVAHFVFRGGRLDTWYHLAAMGLIISVLGQLGDLLISSVKRDLEIKDMGTLFPGHGGLLDRFDSLILAAPAIFYYVGYFRGVGVTEPIRIFSAH